jgi:essential nuclear protein 1
MPKMRGEKKSSQLHQQPLGQQIEKPSGKLRPPRRADQEDDEDDEDAVVPEALGKRIAVQAREQRLDESDGGSRKGGVVAAGGGGAEDSDDYDDDVDEEEEDGDCGADMIEFDGDYVKSAGLSESEEAVVARFLSAGRAETRSLADIIMDKIREKDVEGDADEPGASFSAESSSSSSGAIPAKVVEVYTSVGNMLQHYRSGKLPKALKMLPHLKNWEDVLWITRPDEWSSQATYACTRIFASNLNGKMAQRFFNLVLLEKCRDDIRGNDKLNYHLYLALKKALFKPAAFYKGLLLPLAQSGTCTLREATIIGSVLAKVSIPSNHSAAAILRLAEMPYSGSTSMFIKVLMNKKYALPLRVVEALVAHFYSFEKESRLLPVIWHQALLVFSQRYKYELDEGQRERLKLLLRVQQHHVITPEIRRELFSTEVLAQANEMRY